MRNRHRQRIAIICLAVSFFSFTTLAQLPETAVHRIDSLLRRVKQLPDDTSKVRVLNELATVYFGVNPDSGFFHAHQAISLAKKLNDKRELANAYRALAANYWGKNDFTRSQEYYWQSLKITEQIQDTFGVAKSLHGIATNYAPQYNYPKAIEYYTKAFAVFTSIRNTDGELGCLANIAGLYEEAKHYDSAIVYYSRSLAICRQSSTERDAAYMMGKLGFMNAKQGNYKQALHLEKEALTIFYRLGYNTDIGTALSEIAEIQAMQHHYDEALHYYRKAIRMLARVPGNYFARIKAKNMIAAGNMTLQMAKSATDRSIYVDKVVADIKKAIHTCLLQHEIYGLRDGYQSLSEAQVMQGSYAASLASYKQYIWYRDSLNSIANDKEITRHELEYIYSRQKDSLSHINELQRSELKRIEQQKQLSDLSLKQQWLYNLLIIAALLLAASLFVFRYRTKQLRLRNELTAEKAKSQLKEAEYQRHLNEVSFSALRSQMNPHFIFNALNTIQSYVYANDKKTATHYLGKFSELIRKILDDSSKEMVSLGEETELLQLYIDIEKARFGEDLQASLLVDPSLPAEDIMIPPMLVQPYVENAIKHGLFHKPGIKELCIMITPSPGGDCIDIIVDDNGIGREKSAELNRQKKSHHSFAATANEKRIDLLNQAFNKKARLQITDKQTADGAPAGTRVLIRIPADYYTAKQPADA